MNVKNKIILNVYLILILFALRRHFPLYLRIAIRQIIGNFMSTIKKLSYLLVAKILKLFQKE